MTPSSKQYEQYKKARRGDEMPRLRGRLLALAVQTGDWLVQNPRQTAVMTVDPLDVGLVLAWFQAYYPKSRNRLRVQVHE